MTVHPLNVFFENMPRPAIKTDLPRPQQRIERTDQVIYCSSLLLQDSLPLSSAEQGPTFDKAELAWVAEMKNDPMERDRLLWLAARMVDKFVQDAMKDSTEIAEIVALGPILQKEPYRKLLSSFIKEFDDSQLLDVDLLQGLVQLVQSATPGYLLSDDLIKILSILRIRLQGTHQQSSEYPYHLTLAISRVLDAMADHNIQDLDRVLEHEPLSGVLSGLKGSTDPYLMYQACYAFQALQYVPNNETVLQAVLRHSRGVVDGVVKITALGQLDLGSVLEGLGNLQEALGGMIGVAGTVYEGVGSLMESGQGVMESLKERYGAGQKKPWYAAIRAAYALAEAGQLNDLNRLICEAPCRRDPLFQWGICQLLGEIAVDPIWPIASRQQAVVLLDHLYKDDPEWGRDESVKAWMLTIIDKLGSVANQEIATSAIALKQELASGDTSTTLHSYPLRSRLPTPATSSILMKVQDIPDLEYELYKLRLQRLQDYDDRAVYVLPQAKPSLLAKDDELFPLLEKVLEFLASDRQVMLILGDSGSGKSSFNRHLEHLLWKEYKRGGPIPLFINLAAIEDPQRDMINKQLQSHNFDEDQIMELKLHRQLVIICDGYDESQQLVNLHKTNSLNQAGQWNTKMVISCRTQYLGPSYQDRFKPQSTDRYKSAPQNVFQEAVIAPFSMEQIHNYVDQYVPLEPRTWSTQDYMDKLTGIPNLMDLVKNPFLLLLALEALPDVTEGNQDLSTIKIVRIQLYDTFVNHWLNVNSRRLRSNTLAKEDYDVLDQLDEAGFVTMGIDYSKRLASAMFEKQDGKAIVKYLHLKDKATWKVEYFGPEPEVRLLREASPLTRSGSFFQFIHRSMLEYFFSCTVVGPSATERTDEYSPEPTSDASEAQVLNPDCPLFKRNLLEEPAIIQFLSERVQKNPVFKDQLLEVVERSKADASIANAAASAMTILVKAGVIFHRYDFRGVHIPGADLSGGQFDSALFQGANLTNVNLGMTWLRNADFSNAQMDGVQFGELPYLEVEEYAYACCHSPDGKTLALGLTGGRIELYDTETWEKTGQAKHGRDITSLAYSPDGQRLVSGCEDNTVRVWDCAKSDPILLLDGHTKEVESVAFSPCGKKVASASQDETVRLWDSTTGEVLHVLKGHEDFVNCVRFTPDGRQLVSGSVDDTVRFWDVETGAAGEVWVMDEGTVICLAISPDGRQVVIGHGNGAMRVWSIATRSAGPVLLGNTQETRCVIFSADGQRIASAGYDSTARVWDSTTGTPISVFSSTGLVYDVSFSLDGRNLVSVDASIEIRLWDTRSSGYSMGQLGHCDTVRSVAYQPSGQSILSGSNDGTVRRWDALTGAAGSISVIKDLADTLYSITLSPDLNKAATGSDDGFIEIWDLRSNERGPDLEGHTDDVMELAFSPCNGWIASASEDKTVRLWDLRNGGQGQVLCEMPPDSDTEEDDSSADSDNPFELAFSPTGSQLAVGDWNGTVNVYDIQTRAVLTTTTLDDDAVFSLAYSPNGQELAIGIDGAILFWDLQSKEPGDKLKLNDYGVHPIVYSPCGEWIACGDGYCSLQLCRRQSSEKNTWRCVSVVEGFLMEVMAIAWNPVVPLEFVTGSQDRSIRVWRISDSNDGGVVSVELVWGSNVGVLGASGMRIDDVIGLDAESRRLLIQRGAVDGNSVSKEDESNPNSGGVVKAGDGEESDDGEEETDDDEEDTDDDEDHSDDGEEETDDGEE